MTAKTQPNPNLSPVRQFTGDILRYLPAAILPALFGLVGGIAFTRIFTPTEYGIYGLALAISGPIITILTEWIAQPISRFYAEYKRQNRDAEYHGLVLILSIIIAGLVLFAGIFVTVGFTFLKGYLPYPLTFTGTIAVILTQSILSILLPLLSASLQPNQYRRATVTSSAISVSLALGIVYYVHTDIGWLLWAQAVANLLVLPYVLRKCDIRLDEVSRISFQRTRDILRRFWFYGGPMMLWFVASGMLFAEDRYILQVFRSASEVGIYSANYGLVSGVSGLLRAPVIMAVGPILYHYWAQRRLSDVKHTISRMTEIYLILAFAAVGGFFVAGDAFARILLGQEFHSGTVILLPVLLGQIFWGASIIGHKTLELYERTPQMVLSALVAAVTNLVLNILFVPTYGYIAAAYATLAAYMVYAVIIWKQSRNYIEWHVNINNNILYLSLAVVSSLASKLLLGFLNLENELSIFTIGALLFATLYSLSMFLFARKRIIQLFS